MSSRDRVLRPYLQTVPAAACPRCGGWTSFGGMSQHANSTVPVLGRVGCSCNKKAPPPCGAAVNLECDCPKCQGLD